MLINFKKKKKKRLNNKDKIVRDKLVCSTFFEIDFWFKNKEKKKRRVNWLTDKKEKERKKRKENDWANKMKSSRKSKQKKMRRFG